MYGLANSVQTQASSPVHERVLQEGRDGVDVVLAHLADVLKQKGERFEHAVLHVELRNPVLVHQSWEHGEGGTRLGDDGDSYRRADAVLTFLHLQVVEQRGQHIVRT